VVVGKNHIVLVLLALVVVGAVVVCVMLVVVWKHIKRRNETVDLSLYLMLDLSSTVVDVVVVAAAAPHPGGEF
jgi:hypothetical protein